MKKYLCLLIVIVISITLTSAIQNPSQNSKSITLQAIGNNIGSAALKQSAEIISARLKQYGFSSFEVNVLNDKEQIMILVPDKTDVSEFEGLLTSKGELSFYETYTFKEISELFKPDIQLFNILYHIPAQNSADPRVGCTSVENRMKVNEYIMSSVPNKNCKLVWGFESEKSVCCLFALKINNYGKSLLNRSDVESIKITTPKDSQNPKIHIRLKPAATSVFADATKINLNKAIAIVIDDKVFSWPVVKSVIDGDEIEVSGSFTEKGVNYFPALFNSEQLPIGFKILK